MNPILSIHHLATGYGKKQVLFDVSLNVMPGEIVLITGGNGSGKSTLLKAIYGLISPWNADAEIFYRPDPKGLTISTSAVTNNLANGLAYLPQKNAVFDDLTVEDNFRLAGYILSESGEYKRRREEMLASLPEIVPLLDSKPEKMSGGERQLVGLGMVLLHRPKLLLLDEPLAGLSDNMSQLICNTIERLSLTGTAIVVVEHRAELIKSISDRFILLVLGNLVAGTNQEIVQFKY